MTFVSLMAAAAAAPAGDNPYGLMQALNEGGLISWATFVILVAMFAGGVKPLALHVIESRTQDLHGFCPVLMLRFL